jgi:hypothetical protein
MANINGAFGLRPIAKMGQSPTAPVHPSTVLLQATRTRSIRALPSSRWQPVSSTSSALQRVALWVCLGVFWGCEYVSSTTGKKVFSNQWPGSGADTNFPVKAFVYDDPAQLFVIATSNVVAAADTEAEVRAAVFANANFAFATSGSTTTGISSATLDLNTIATTNTLNLRIMGIQDDPENADFTDEGIPVIVRLNNHFNSPNGAIAGGTVSTTGV